MSVITMLWLLLLALVDLRSGALLAEPAAILSSENNCHFAARAFARQMEEDGSPLRVIGHSCVRQERV